MVAALFRSTLFFASILVLFVSKLDAAPKHDSSSIRSPTNPLISYKLDEDDNISETDSGGGDSQSDDNSDADASFEPRPRHRKLRSRDDSGSLATSMRSPTNRLIAYRFNENDNTDDEDFSTRSYRRSRNRKNHNQDKSDDYYDYVEKSKHRNAFEKSGESDEETTEKPRISTKLWVSSGSEEQTTIRSPTNRLISYRLDDEDDIPPRQFEKAKKAFSAVLNFILERIPFIGGILKEENTAKDSVDAETGSTTDASFEFTSRVKREAPSRASLQNAKERLMASYAAKSRQKDYVEDEEDLYYEYRLRRARLLRRLRELDAEAPTCCSSYSYPRRYYPSYQLYYGSSYGNYGRSYYQPYGRTYYQPYGSYYPGYSGYGGYSGTLGGYGGIPPQALDLGIGWGVNVGIPAAGMGVGVNHGLGVTVG